MKFRKKPVVIEAEQWFPDKQIEGVNIRRPEIIYSADGKLFYINYLVSNSYRSSMWLTKEKITGPVPAEKKNPNALFGPFPLEIKLNSGEIYYRMAYPFNAYEIRSQGAGSDADLDSDEFKDFVSAEGWKFPLPKKAYIQTLEGSHDVSPGDWIITGVKGERYPCKPDIFEATYEKVEEK